MKNQNAGKSRLFFMEFLIVLFFFLIVSTICLRLFVKAHQITQNANALAHAQSAAASVAEVLSNGHGTAEEVAAYFPEAAVKTTSEQNKGNSGSEDNSGIMTENAAEDESNSKASVSSETIADNAPSEDSYTLTVLYDREFVPCDSKQQPYYTLTAIVTLPGNEKTADITVYDARQNAIYNLSVSFHTPVTREEALS